MSNVMPYNNTLYSDMTEEMINDWKMAFKRRLEKAKEEFNPDIVFAHHLWMLTSIVREIFPDTKIIGLCHNTDLRQASINTILKDKYLTKIDKIDNIFTATEEQKDRSITE